MAFIVAWLHTSPRSPGRPESQVNRKALLAPYNSLKCQPSPLPNPQPLWVRGRRRLTFQTNLVIASHPYNASYDETLDLHLSKALFSLDPENLQLHCFLGLGALFCCSFFYSLDQPCTTLQTVQVASRRNASHGGRTSSGFVTSSGFRFTSPSNKRPPF